MDPRPTDQHADLIRRFSAGERSPELLTALNQAAFAHFHAPWEEPPSPSKLPPLVTCFSEDVDDDEDGPEEPEAPNPALDLLLADLLKRGCQPFIQDGPEVIVVLPRDPGADFQIRAHFILRTGTERLHVKTRADLLHPPAADARLRDFCSAWNQSGGRVRAHVFRHQPQGRDRMEVSAHIPMARASRPQAFQSALATLLGDINRFWWKAYLDLGQPGG